MTYCDQGCCEIMDGWEDDYRVCADCGNDAGHEHGKPCRFCGAGSGLGPEVRAAREQAQIAEMHDHAVKAIEEDKQDPRTQSYFMRMDKRRVVKSEEEFNRCREQDIPMRIIDHRTALLTLQAEKGQRSKTAKHKAKAKAARQSRKKNRSR